MSLFDSLLGLGGSLAGAGLGFMGAQEAADASKKAGKLQWQQYQQSRADYEPWRLAGVASLGQLSDAILRGDASKFFTSPGYQWRMDQGMKQLQGRAAAKGGLESGATLKALNDYGQNQASEEYANWLDNLMGVAGFGRQATRDVASLGASAADRYGGYSTDAGAMRGSAYANLGNQLTTGLGDWISQRYNRRPGNVPSIAERYPGASAIF